MIEVFDIEDTSFLKQYEQELMEQEEKVQMAGAKMLFNLPQYQMKQDITKRLFSHFDNLFYPDYIRIDHTSYIFRFKPDTPTMLPHVDFDLETCKHIKGKAKRVIIYVNPVWNTKWKGGTYFDAFENHKVNSRSVARTPKAKFMEQATYVENVPGRAVVFDPDELHLPDECSGNNVQRLTFAGLIVHPDYRYIIDELEGPDNINGSAVTRVSSPQT